MDAIDVILGAGILEPRVKALENEVDNLPKAFVPKGRVNTVADLANVQNPEVGWVYLVGLEADPNKPEYWYTAARTWEYLGQQVTVDANPTQGSSNPVSSGGVYTALSDKIDISSVTDTPTQGSSNPFSAGGAYTEFAKDQAEIDWSINTGVKNLFEITAETQTINGITFTVDKAAGTVTVNGTPTDPEQISAFQAGCFYGEQGKEYILTGDPGSGGSTTHYLRITYYGNDYGSGYTFTQGSNNGYVEVTMRAGYSPNNIVFKPMIRPAAITDDTFKPYAMSNPELTAQLVTVTPTGDMYIGNVCVRKYLTQAEYDLLDPPDERCDYKIVEATT